MKQSSNITSNSKIKPGFVIICEFSSETVNFRPDIKFVRWGTFLG